MIVGLDALATCYHKQARQDEARQLAQEVLTLAEQHVDFLAQKNALFLLAEIEFRLGHLAAAETFNEGMFTGGTQERKSVGAGWLP